MTGIIDTVRQWLGVAERGADVYRDVSRSTTRLMLLTMAGVVAGTMILIAFVAWAF